jgi:hypothetical protein
MDGWVGGWVDGWMGTRVGLRVSGWMEAVGAKDDGQMDGWMDLMDGQTVGQTDGRTHVTGGIGARWLIHPSVNPSIHHPSIHPSIHHVTGGIGTRCLIHPSIHHVTGGIGACWLVRPSVHPSCWLEAPAALGASFRAPRWPSGIILSVSAALGILCMDPKQNDETCAWTTAVCIGPQNSLQ